MNAQRRLLAARHLLLALALAVLLTLPASAYAATFSAALPAPGTTVTASPAVVSVAAANAVPILGTPLVSVDGRVLPATLTYAIVTPGYWAYDPDWDEDYWVPPVYDYTRATVSCAPGVLGDGQRAASVALPSGAGDFAWSFGVAEKPVLGAVTPPTGTTTTTAAPAITVRASDNSGVATWSATIDGLPVPATLDASGTLRLDAVPANFAAHTASVTVRDAAGNAATKTWTFTISAPVFTWSGEVPAREAVVTTAAPRVVSADIRCTSVLLSATKKVYFDGVLASSVFLKPYPTDLTRATIVGYPAAVGRDGTHTVAISVGCVGGASSTNTWTYAVRIPPVLGVPTPAPGSSTATTSPVILVPASDNGTVAMATATINGAPAPAVFEPATGKVRITPTEALPAGDVTVVSVSVFDAVGARRDLTWSFMVETREAMAGSANECEDCHPGIGSAPDMTPDCEACHDEHIGTTSSYHLAADTTGCKPCHSSALLVEHARPGFTCVTCHNSTEANVKTAIGADDSRCASCHADLGSGHFAVHDTDVADNALASTSLTCGDCHDANLMTEHEDLAPPPGSTTTCALCHPTLRAAITAFDDETCVQSGCHVEGGAEEMHASLATAHTAGPTGASCFGSECHVAGDLVALHVDATATVDGVARSSCLVCHAGGLPQSADCTVCHPDRVAAHGYDPAKHVSSESCLLECHAAELKPAHAAEATAKTTGCSECHAVVGSIKPWDGTCTTCHATAVDEHAPASHVGTDAAVFEISPTTSAFVHGCSDYPDGIPSQTNCHDISSLTTIHATMPDKGCSVCHASGNTPKRECLDCHREGQATSYAQVQSEEGSVTIYPSSDASMTGGWTYTTTPAGGSFYSGVDAPYPPVDLTGYTTVTTSTAGGVLFGFSRPSIPASAVITSVQIYAKARGSNSSYPRRLSGWADVGGTVYTSTNQSGNLPNGSWLGGTGAGQAFALATRYLYDPDYHAISVNPKTGQDWTVDQLTGSGPNSLNAFGVKLTATSSPNRVSNVDLAQVYVKVVYEIRTQVGDYPTLGSSIYHHNNVKYLHDPADAGGKRYAFDPVAHGWYEALYYQDCYDFCHYGNGGAATFSADEGSWMWYSVGGDPYDAVAGTRTLTLAPVTIPADSPRLDFVTNYQLGTGAAGYVEVSTDGGGVWTPLTGTVDGSGKTSLTGNAVGWVPAGYDLSAYAGQSASLRFRYVNGSSMSAGWAFDSLSLSGDGHVVFSDDAETLKPDWTNRYWTRAKGAFPY